MFAGNVSKSFKLMFCFSKMNVVVFNLKLRRICLKTALKMPNLSFLFVKSLKKLRYLFPFLEKSLTRSSHTRFSSPHRRLPCNGEKYLFYAPLMLIKITPLKHTRLNCAKNHSLSSYAEDIRTLLLSSPCTVI
jgi:hypothetical protein